MNLEKLIKKVLRYDRFRFSLQLWETSFEFFFLNRIISKFPSHTFRLFILRRMGAKLDKKSAIQSGCEYWAPGNLEIGAGSVIGFKVMLDSRKGIFIGKNVTVATEVMIWTLQHDYNDTNFKAVGERVTINDYAWLCSRCIILPVIRIIKSAVVSSSDFVTKKVESYTVVGGIPSKKIVIRNTNLDYVPSNYQLHNV